MTGAGSKGETALGRAAYSYRLRLRRRRYLVRALRKRRELRPLRLRVAEAPKGAVRCFATMRNEMVRLPHFLDHYRGLGVGHFLIVDNDSDDGTAEFLAAQPDCSVWQTSASYREARFGLDWVNWLLFRHGTGHWCLTVDADELLIYPHHDSKGLSDLTAWLDAHGIEMMATLMLELYPKGPLSLARTDPEKPLAALKWFDPWGYAWTRQERYGNISIRGGPRQRLFFDDEPEHAPHMHKTPLIRWRLPYVYLSSTHLALPRRLNQGFDARLNQPTGVLLHTKFLPNVIEKSIEEKERQQHFTHTERYEEYYDAVIDDPDLWTAQSQRYEGWVQLQRLGLLTGGNWP